MELDETKIDEAVLALLYLNRCKITVGNVWSAVRLQARTCWNET